MEGLTYAGCHGLQIVHPDGQKFSHNIPADYTARLNGLVEELEREVRRRFLSVRTKSKLID